MYSNDLVCNILIFINKNNDISINDLEYKFNYNRYYIMKLFKKEIKYTIIDYINYLKIYKAIILLKETNYSLTKIAIICNFNSLEYFSRIFKKITNYSPNKFKLFFTNRNKLNIEDINKINKVIIKLYNINKIKDKYIRNRKIMPKETTLSIFKKKY